jgi:non-ribosomal peptide synthetase component F
VEAVQPPRDTSRTPLFQVNFRAPQTKYPVLSLDGVTAGVVELVDNGTSKFDLALEVGAFAGEPNYFEYCTDLFREETILKMEDDFRTLLAALIAEPDTPVSRSAAVTAIGRQSQPAIANAV